MLLRRRIELVQFPSWATRRRVPRTNLTSRSSLFRSGAGPEVIEPLGDLRPAAHPRQGAKRGQSPGCGEARGVGVVVRYVEVHRLARIPSPSVGEEDGAGSGPGEARADLAGPGAWTGQQVTVHSPSLEDEPE